MLLFAKEPKYLFLIVIIRLSLNDKNTFVHGSLLVNDFEKKPRGAKLKGLSQQNLDNGGVVKHLTPS